MQDYDSTPLHLVQVLDHILPDCYGQMDRCRSAKLDGNMTWPDYCVLPINAAFTYLSCCKNLPEHNCAQIAAEIIAAYTWRQNKVIYEFDPDLSRVLQEQAADTKDDDKIPVNLLLHLPYPCIYIKAPGILRDTDGFFAWIDYDLNRNGPELRIQWLADTMDCTFPQVMHIYPGWTIQACMYDTARYTASVVGNDPDNVAYQAAKTEKTFLSALQHILYLISQDSDISDRPIPLKLQNKTKSGKTITFSREEGEIQYKEVGVHIGSVIRKARAHYEQRENADGSGETKRPHARRGHWHHYWTGPKKSKNRTLILKWTAPTFIHADDFSDDNVVIYPVKDT